MAKAKIELILAPNETPYADPGFYHYSPLPLSIGVLTSYLRSQGYMVQATDLNTRMNKNLAERGNQWWGPLFQQDLILTHLRSGAPTGLEDELDWFIEETSARDNDIIGISTGSNMSFFEIHIAFLVGKRLQTQYHKTVVYGGANIDFLWQFREFFDELWQALFVSFSYFILGPGERTFAELIAGLTGESDSRPYHELPGAIYYAGDKLTRNPEDTPSFCCPDFTALTLEPYKLCFYRGEDETEAVRKNLEHFYKMPIYMNTVYSENNRKCLPEKNREETLFLSYYFNHNCTYRCAFCVQSREDALPFSTKAAQEAVTDLNILLHQYNTKYLRFFNNAFNISPAFVREFCSLVIEHKLEFYWSDCARFNNLTEELLRLMYQAGCRKLVFGLDTASKRLARLINKQLDFNQVERVLRWCREIGIWAEVEIIVGLPYEGEEEFMETYDFIKTNQDNGLLNGFHLNRYYIVPSSLLGSYPERYGIEVLHSSEGYKGMLERGAKIMNVLTATNGEAIHNSLYAYRLLGFHELHGRTSEQINQETEDKLRRIRQLVARLPQ